MLFVLIRFSNFIAKFLNNLVFLKAFKIGMNIIATTGTTKLVAIKDVKKLLIGLKAFAPQISVLMPNGIAPLSSKNW